MLKFAILNDYGKHKFFLQRLTSSRSWNLSYNELSYIEMLSGVTVQLLVSAHYIEQIFFRLQFPDILLSDTPDCKNLHEEALIPTMLPIIMSCDFI